MRIFVLTVSYELRESRKTHLHDNPRPLYHWLLLQLVMPSRHQHTTFHALKGYYQEFYYLLFRLGSKVQGLTLVVEFIKYILN